MPPTEENLKQIAEEIVLEIVLYAYQWKRADDPAIPEKEIWNYAIVESRAKEMAEQILRKHLLPASRQMALETVALLKASGIAATWEHPGYISTYTPGGLHLCVGTTNGYWRHSVMDSDGYDHTPGATPEMDALKDVAPETVAPEQLAAAIRSILAAPPKTIF